MIQKSDLVLIIKKVFVVGQLEDWLHSRSFLLSSLTRIINFGFVNYS